VSVASGQTVTDLDPRSRAAREIEAFVTELVRDYEQENSHDSTAAGRVAGSCERLRTQQKPECVCWKSITS
jgi:hypothetical protein